MLYFDLDSLDLSPEAREVIMQLLNIVEGLKSQNRDLRVEVQQLRDENNRLKGEQAKPNIKPNKKKKEQQEDSEPANKEPKNQYSSESQRQQPDDKSGSRKKSKRDQIKIDREVVLDIDRQTLPADAKGKGLPRGHRTRY